MLSVLYFADMRDLSNWAENTKAPLINLYGEEGLAAMVSQWVDTLLGIYKNKDGDICKDCLSKISCPTLIIQGTKDAMIAPEHPGYLLKHIRHSK
jgi:valacyclovir hydrolase